CARAYFGLGYYTFDYW
nr:immunoglobulin heavy chain junction region [Macaca mulatta]MOV40895.1 immunoglobulin heavy chain junction region [Macaca mulatta]MOV42276.1 immunoglobulin heavy chain junction region [Macaca mulatta]MOV42465.1 immunoglobulin heavy chain junction region [Macaca mulatta]MOV44027.1 immunoglobulin heavy chain junction region [Macaca mulatta]